mmetsp:Transcript_11730/g.14605  ORF Transcript_11730/g.14605 Transcript_11730/m.14605 type:complete len:94 (+) Transcript_11730:618-899(+)
MDEAETASAAGRVGEAPASLEILGVMAGKDAIISEMESRGASVGEAREEDMRNNRQDRKKQIETNIKFNRIDQIAALVCSEFKVSDLAREVSL